MSSDGDQVTVGDGVAATPLVQHTAEKAADSGDGRPGEVPCPFCARPMPAAGRKCTECHEWRSWRRFVPASATGLSLILALISILSIVGPQFIRFMWPDSETRVYIVSSDEKDLLAAVANVGRQPAVIRSYWVSFDQSAFPEETEMGLTNGKPVLMPDEHDIVRLNLKQLSIPASQREAIGDWLKAGHVTLRVMVKESNDVAPRGETPRHDVIEARYLEGWIMKHIDWTD